MFYIILIAAVVFALVLLFRDDHDGSYDRRGDSRRRYQSESQQPPSQAPVPPKPSSVKTAPADKTTVRSPEPPKSEYPVPDRTLSWSYLYSLEYDEDICGDTMETEITGMRYYCSLADLGPVNGIVKPEPDNPHDHRAQVVIRSDGKKLGYIPWTNTRTSMRTASSVRSPAWSRSTTTDICMRTSSSPFPRAWIS